MQALPGGYREGPHPLSVPQAAPEGAHGARSHDSSFPGYAYRDARANTLFPLHLACLARPTIARKWSRAAGGWSTPFARWRWFRRGCATPRAVRGSDDVQPLLARRRREGPVDLAQQLLGDAEVARGGIGADVLHVRRLGNGADTVLAQHPCERERGRGGAHLRGEGGEAAILHQRALVQRGIRHDADALLSAPRQQVVLDAAARGVVEHLVGGEPVAAGEAAQLLEIRHVEVRHTPALDLAALDEAFERLDRLRERDAAAPMQQVEVDAVDPEALERTVARCHQLLARGMVRIELRHQVHLVAAAADGLAHDLLRAAIAIHLRGVDEVQPEIEARAQRRHFARAVRAGLSYVPGPEAQPRHLSLPHSACASAPYCGFTRDCA